MLFLPRLTLLNVFLPFNTLSQLATRRRHRPYSRIGDFFRVDESRQHPPAFGEGALHSGNSQTARVITGVERPIRRADVLRRLGVSDNDHQPASLGIA